MIIYFSNLIAKGILNILPKNLANLDFGNIQQIKEDYLVLFLKLKKMVCEENCLSNRWCPLIFSFEIPYLKRDCLPPSVMWQEKHAACVRKEISRTGAWVQILPVFWALIYGIRRGPTQMIEKF